MARKPMETLTESMFYVLLALSVRDMCGTELTSYVRKLTGGRVSMGPGTLYAIISRFSSECIIHEVGRAGRKITYSITDRGRKIYEDELNRLKMCIEDAGGRGNENMEDDGV